MLKTEARLKLRKVQLRTVKKRLLGGNPVIRIKSDVYNSYMSLFTFIIYVYSYISVNNSEK